MDQINRIKSEIRKNWTSGKHPISFSGLTNVQKQYPHVSKDIIEDALAGIDTYTLFREEKKPSTVKVKLSFKIEHLCIRYIMQT